MKLNYLIPLKNRLRNPKMNEQNLSYRYTEDASHSSELFKQLWLYLNPYRDDTIEKAAAFDFLLLMMFNIGHLSERDMSTLLARYLIKYYEGLDIALKSETTTNNVENSSRHLTAMLNSSRSRGNTDLQGLNSSSVHSFPTQRLIDSESQQS